jgi:hypothetical protein
MESATAHTTIKVESVDVPTPLRLGNPSGANGPIKSWIEFQYDRLPAVSLDNALDDEDRKWISLVIKSRNQWLHDNPF